MKIEKACIIFNKLAFVFFGVDAEDIKDEVIANIKNAVLAASTQGKFKPDPIAQVGKEFPDMFFELTLSGPNGRDIKIEDVFVNTSDQAIIAKYNNFSVQLKEYLDKNWAILPQKHKDKEVKYDDLRIKIVFP